MADARQKRFGRQTNRRFGFGRILIEFWRECNYKSEFDEDFIFYDCLLIKIGKFVIEI